MEKISFVSGPIWNEFKSANFSSEVIDEHGQLAQEVLSYYEIAQDFFDIRFDLPKASLGGIDLRSLEQTEFISKDVGEEVLKKEISHFENLIQSLSSILLLPRNKGVHHIQTMFGPKMEKSSTALTPVPVQKSKDLAPEVQQKSKPSKTLKPLKPLKTLKPLKPLKLAKHLSSGNQVVCASQSLRKSSTSPKNLTCSGNPQTMQTLGLRQTLLSDEVILKLEVSAGEGYTSGLSDESIETFLISRFERYK